MPRVKKSKKTKFYVYHLLGKRDGKTTILGSSRNLEELKQKHRAQGWRDSEFSVEETLDEWDGKTK